MQGVKNCIFHGLRTQLVSLFFSNKNTAYAFYFTLAMIILLSWANLGKIYVHDIIKYLIKQL